MRDLDGWLKETAWHKPYWADIHAQAKKLGSDGCTGVPDWFLWSCLEHDVHYRLHKFLSGDDIDKRTADYVLRVRVQQGSYLGAFSPVSWIRWLGVTLLPAAKRAWRSNAAKILLLCSLLSGCVPGGLWMHDPSNMTPEQLEKYKTMGYRAVRCATVAGGPPIGGRVTSVTVPMDSKAEVTFGPDCTVMGVKLIP